VTHNQPQSDLVARSKQFHWKGEDDDRIQKSSLSQSPQDKESGIALEPQRIRSFVIQYTSASQEKAQKVEANPL